MRTQTIEFGKFIRNEWKEEKRVLFLPVAGGYAVFVPRAAFAVEQATKDQTFQDVLSATFGIVDWLCVGVFIVSGLNFMFGNRTKAMELLLGGSIGYIIARKARTIQEFLEGIVG